MPALTSRVGMIDSSMNLCPALYAGTWRKTARWPVKWTPPRGQTALPSPAAGTDASDVGSVQLSKQPPSLWLAGILVSTRKQSSDLVGDEDVWIVPEDNDTGKRI